jgi:hypothetical protein
LFFGFVVLQGTLVVAAIRLRDPVRPSTLNLRQGNEESGLENKSRSLNPR